MEKAIPTPQVEIDDAIARQFAEMEKQIDDDFAKNVAVGKGCYGSLAYDANDGVCSECHLFVECGDEHAARRFSLLEMEEMNIRTAESAAQVEQELIEMIESRKSPEAVTEIGLTETVEPGATPASGGASPAKALPEGSGGEVEKRLKGAKKKAGKPAAGDLEAKGCDPNWETLFTTMIELRPPLYREAVRIVRRQAEAEGLAAEWTTKAAVSRGYRWTKKALSRLAARGVVNWDVKNKEIEWI